MTCHKYEGKRGTTYWYTVDVAPKGQKRKQVQRRGFRSKKACETARNKELTERHEGTYVEPSRESTRAYLERWRLASAPRWRPSTQQRVALECRALSRELGDVPLGRLDALTIQAAYTRLLARYAPSSLHLIHGTLKHALTQAVRWKLIRDNPAAGVSLPAVPAKPVTAWSAAERERFLAATEGDPLYPLWLFLLDSGCRIGEALALTWEDLDLTTGYVTIRRTLTKGEGRHNQIGTDTKTPASRRSFQLSEETVKVLLRHRNARTEVRAFLEGQSGEFPLQSVSTTNLLPDKLETGRQSRGVQTQGLPLCFPTDQLAGMDGSIAPQRPDDNTLIFDRGDGEPWGDGAVHYRLQCACRAAGVPVLSTHGLRRTMTTLWLEAGVNPAVVAARLGHRNVQLTLSLYTRISQAWGERGVDQVSEYLRKEGAGEARTRIG